MRLFENARALAIGLVVALVALTVFEWFFAPHYRPVFPWHHVAGYSALFGLLAASAFTALTYYVLKPLLQRADNRTDEEPAEKKGGAE